MVDTTPCNLFEPAACDNDGSGGPSSDPDGLVDDVANARGKALVHPTCCWLEGSMIGIVCDFDVGCDTFSGTSKTDP